MKSASLFLSQKWSHELSEDILSNYVFEYLIEYTLVRPSLHRSVCLPDTPEMCKSLKKYRNYINSIITVYSANTTFGTLKEREKIEQILLKYR